MTITVEEVSLPCMPVKLTGVSCIQSVHVVNRIGHIETH